MTNLQDLPEGLPVPQDDGACDHLAGMSVRDISLESTSGQKVSLTDLAKKRTVLYIYPMTGRPDRNLPSDWDEIPGARGCTPQSCSFRDHYHELKDLGADVYGLSTQPSSYQQEVKTRLHLPFELLSDVDLKLAKTLRLPTFQVEVLESISPDINAVLIKRITLVLSNGKVEKVFYPVFPADKNAEQVLEYLRSQNQV
jgi:peroxiredoxin